MSARGTHTRQYDQSTLSFVPQPWLFPLSQKEGKELTNNKS